jgi:hypothetical protein
LPNINGQPVRRQRTRGNVVVGEETRPGRNTVHGLAQVDAEFLRLAGALAPDGRGPHPARHRGNRHARTKPEATIQNRIAPGEQHAPARILGTAADSAHKIGKGAGD